MALLFTITLVYTVYAFVKWGLLLTSSNSRSVKIIFIKGGFHQLEKSQQVWMMMMFAAKLNVGVVESVSSSK